MKWVFVPVAFCALGYFVLGPKIGGASPSAPKEPSSARTSEDAANDNEPVVSETQRPSRTAQSVRAPTSGPEMEVSAKPVTVAKARKRPQPKLAEPKPVAPEPQTDPASDATVPPVPPDPSNIPPSQATKSSEDGG